MSVLLSAFMGLFGSKYYNALIDMRPSLRKIAVYFPGKLPSFDQFQVGVSVSKLQILIKGCVNSVDGSIWVYFLKSPELVYASMAHILNDMCVLLELLSKNVQIHFVVKTFDDVYFTCLQNIPSLIVSVIWFINDDFFSFLLGAFGNINQFFVICWNYEAGFL